MIDSYRYIRGRPFSSGNGFETCCGQMEDERRKKRRLAREEERTRLLNQIDRGLVEAAKEIKVVAANYSKLVQDGTDMDERLTSWGRFFNDISLVSEERELASEDTAKI